MTSNEERWLVWASELQAIAQNGLTFTKDPYDIERYQAIRRLAAEILERHSDVTSEQLLTCWLADVGYMTPKVDVRGVVFRDEQILLVQESQDSCWSLPGGWADINQSPAESVVREIQEETGFHTKASKLLAVYDKQKHDHPIAYPHAFKLFFRCELLGGKATPSEETLAVRFFDENDLPQLSQDRVSLLQIKRMFEHHRDPSLETDFD